MFRATFLTAVLLGGAGIVLSAQEQQQRKPGPEHRNLAYFAGVWSSAGKMEAGPFGPGGEMRALTKCQWFEGGFQLICRGAGTGPTGQIYNLGIMGYNTDTQRYTYYGIDNAGNGDLAHGQVSGTTWTWEGSWTLGDRNLKTRYVIEAKGPVTYDWKWEIESGDGKGWTLVASGTDTRTEE